MTLLPLSANLMVGGCRLAAVLAVIQSEPRLNSSAMLALDAIRLVSSAAVTVLVLSPAS